MSLSSDSLKRSSVAVLGIGLLLATGCANHVKLAFPGASPGAQYVCRAETDCTPATDLVASDLNRSGTVFVTMPSQCGGHFREIVVLDADSSSPTVVVTCAPVEEPMDEMTMPPTSMSTPKPAPATTPNGTAAALDGDA